MNWILAAAEWVTLASDIGRAITLLLFALFIGGGVWVISLYRKKNARYRAATGSNRPMFRHVGFVASGAIIAASSAATNTLVRLGEGFTWDIPVNLVAFACLYLGMLNMLRESTQKVGWLKPEDETAETKKFAEEVVGEAIADPNAARALVEAADEMDAER